MPGNDGTRRYALFRYVWIRDTFIGPDEQPPEEPRFQRGDCNADGSVNISDATCALNWLFAGAPEPGCLASLNANGDGEVNITDPVWLLSFLFAGGPALLSITVHRLAFDRPRWRDAGRLCLVGEGIILTGR